MENYKKLTNEVGAPLPIMKTLLQPARAALL